MPVTGPAGASSRHMFHCIYLLFLDLSGCLYLPFLLKSAWILLPTGSLLMLRWACLSLEAVISELCQTLR